MSYILFCLFLLCPAFVLTENSLSTYVPVLPKNYEIFIDTEERHFKDSNKTLKYKGRVNIEFEFGHGIPDEDEFHFSLNVVPDTEIAAVKMVGKYKLPKISQSVGSASIFVGLNFLVSRCHLSSLSRDFKSNQKIY